MKQCKKCKPGVDAICTTCGAVVITTSSKQLKEVPCVVRLSFDTQAIICGPFATRQAAEAFATALAHGGCIEWRTAVKIEEWNA